MFLAIDRVSKFTYVEFRDDAGKMNGAEFLRGVVEAFPYAIHTVLTDNGMAFADCQRTEMDRPGDIWALTSSTASAMRTVSSTNLPSDVTPVVSSTWS